MRKNPRRILSPQRLPFRHPGAGSTNLANAGNYCNRTAGGYCRAHGFTRATAKLSVADASRTVTLVVDREPRCRQMTTAKTTANMLHIESAESPELVSVARELFVEYSESLGVDLCFQGFAEELARLPGEYARPAGRLILAFDGEHAVGCGALRGIDDRICEMKRVYLRPSVRGRGAGRLLIDTLIEMAHEIGYERVRLDTLPSMTRAKAIYRSLGFKEIAAYRVNPVPGALFLELDLRTQATSE
jgi:putative acetyltransferase